MKVKQIKRICQVELELAVGKNPVNQNLMYCEESYWQPEVLYNY